MTRLICAVSVLAFISSCRCDGDDAKPDGGVEDAGIVIDEKDAGGPPVDAGAIDAGNAPTVTISAPSVITTGKLGLIASVTQTEATSIIWSITGGTITAGDTSDTITFTAGDIGTLSLVCTVINSQGAATVFAHMRVVAAPTAPLIRFLLDSDQVPVATRGREGLSVFVTPVANSTHTWSIEGGTFTTATTGDSMQYTAGTGGEIVFTATETNEAGDVSAPSTARQPLTENTVSLWVGALGGPGNLDGIGPNARLSYPTDVALAPDGTAFIVDQDNASIRILRADGTLTTLTDAGLSYPGSIARSSDGGLYVTDLTLVKHVTADGTVTTAAGNGTYGSIDGPGATSSFGALGGIAVDPAGSLFVSDWAFGTLRKLTGIVDGGFTSSTVRTHLTNPRGLAVSSSGLVYIAAASSCSIDVINGNTRTVIGDAGCGKVDGPLDTAQFSVPWALRFTASGDLLVSESFNQAVRSISLSVDGGAVTTLGSVREPRGLDLDSSGNAWVAQGGLHTISKVTDAGTVTLAGLGPHAGWADGDAGIARFALYGSGSVATDPRTGTLYVTDSTNQTLRAISPQARVSTVIGKVGQFGFADGARSSALMSAPAGIALDSTTKTVWVADQGNGAIRAYSLTGEKMTTPVGGGLPCNGSLDGIGVNAGLCAPTAIAIDALHGLIYVADTATHRVYELTPSGQPDGTFRAKAIIGTGACEEDGLCVPSGLAVDSAGTLYIADTGHHLIRAWQGGVLTTIAGTGSCSANDGTSIGLCAPQGLTLLRGALYVADTGNGTVRKLVLSGGSWSSTTLLGSPGKHGTVINGASTTLNRPTSLAATPVGDLVIVDANENALISYRP